jgi:hypothetical protein
MTQIITVQLPGFDKPIIIENENMVSQKSLSSKMAWDWGSVLDRYLKGIESICDKFSDDRLNSALSLSTEATVGENIKKAIDWVIEKLKMLAKLIRDFFKKVKEYLSGGKHDKAISENERAVNVLTKLGKSQPGHEIFKKLITKNLIFVYSNAKLWKLSNEATSGIDESFRWVASNIKDKDVSKIEFGRRLGENESIYLNTANGWYSVIPSAIQRIPHKVS